MGLLRIATVVAIGVALLPSDKDQQQRLYAHAGEAATWALTYCDRNASTCAKGGELWTQFLTKAEFGAKLAYQTWRDRQSPADNNDPPYSPASLKPPAPALERDGDTLTPLDRRPPWRGKHRDKGSI